jgi:hypothetical protein
LVDLGWDVGLKELRPVWLMGPELAADRFTDLHKQVPEEIAYLRSDTERRLSEAASRAASARLYGSRLATMAQQLLDAVLPAKSHCPTP